MPNRPDPDRAVVRVIALQDAPLSIVHGFDFQASPLFHGRGNNSRNFRGAGRPSSHWPPGQFHGTAPGVPLRRGEWQKKGRGPVPAYRVTASSRRPVGASCWRPAVALRPTRGKRSSHSARPTGTRFMPMSVGACRIAEQYGRCHRPLLHGRRLFVQDLGRRRQPSPLEGFAVQIGLETVDCRRFDQRTPSAERETWLALLSQDDDWAAHVEHSL
jgi:hypothetical protein